MKTATPYAEALTLAEELLGILAPVCKRIEIAGSLRRGKPEVGDIELVAIPLYEAEHNLLGDEIGRHSLLDAELRAWPPITGTLAKNGDRYKQFAWGGMTVDLFLVTAETWGVQLAIRTGGADFSHWLVTPSAKGGALPHGYSVSDGRLWIGAIQLPTPEEVDLFDALGLPHLPPTHSLRSAKNWHVFNEFSRKEMEP